MARGWSFGAVCGGRTLRGLVGCVPITPSGVAGTYCFGMVMLFRERPRIWRFGAGLVWSHPSSDGYITDRIPFIRNQIR
jgi:hypothetical protein